MSKSILGQSISNDKSNDNQIIPGFWHRDWTNSTRRYGSTLGSNDSRQSQRYTFKPKDFVTATNTIVYIQSYITKEPSNQVVWYIRCMPAAADFALRNSSFKNLHKPNGSFRSHHLNKSHDHYYCLVEDSSLIIFLNFIFPFFFCHKRV